MNDRPNKDELMMCLAIMCSRMSTCSRLRVGSVITDERHEQICVGYNGGYRGGPNECLRPGEGVCGCIHSEINSLLKLRFRPCSMYVTDSPCEACAAAIVNAGVERVYYAREYRRQEGLELLHSAKVHTYDMRPGLLAERMLLMFGARVWEEPFSWRPVLLGGGGI